MLSQSFALLAGAATLALAATPSGFQPASDTQLFVEFGNIRALNGALVSKEASSVAPQVGTESQLTGASYTIIMVDLDIPTNTTETNTLLHWMQTGLTPATTETTLNTDQLFLLEVPSDTAALAPYIGPNPPARNPLSHRYTQILVDTSDLSTDGTSVLASAAQTRRGFNALSVLTQAGLEGEVIAGNYFNVTNPGPAQGTATGGTFPNTTATGGGSASGTGSAPSTTPPVIPNGGVVIGLPGFALLALLGVLGVFMAL